jgi:hypothetical protein
VVGAAANLAINAMGETILDKYMGSVVMTVKDTFEEVLSEFM